LKTYADHFSLNLASELLTEWTPPAGPFQPQGAWEHRYRIHTLVSATGKRRLDRPAGTLNLRRVPAGRGFELHVDHRKLTAGSAVSRVHGVLRCVSDGLGRPVSWTLEEQLAPSFVNKYSGEVKDGVLKIGALKLSRPIRGAYTSSWALFEAVQRRKPANGPPIQFAMLDPLEVVKPDQSLEFWKTVELASGMHWHGFLQHGWGISPQVYWLDESHRLVVVVTGIDVYVLEGSSC
jgi:hypothetical protein